MDKIILPGSALLTFVRFFGKIIRLFDKGDVRAVIFFSLLFDKV